MSKIDKIKTKIILVIREISCVYFANKEEIII
jgi:hypothetical protein